VPKFTAAERTLVKTIIDGLSIKRILESEIINEVYKQTNKRLSLSMLYHCSIFTDGARWYNNINIYIFY